MLPRPIRSRLLASCSTATPAVLAAALITAAPTSAQLPDGHLVVSSYTRTSNGARPGVGGLYFVDPASNAVTPVTGLPCEISGTCPNSVSIDGADVVVQLPDTGQIIACAWGDLGQPVRMFLLDMNGANVVGSTQYQLATVANFDGLACPAGALLADGRVLLAMDPTNSVAPGALAGARLGIFDPTLPPGDPNALTVVPVSGTITGVVNALAVDLVRGVAYLGMLPRVSATTGSIFEVPVPAGGPARFIASTPLATASMAVEPDGGLLVGGWNGQTGSLARVDPATGSTQIFPQSLSRNQIQALRIDQVTGDLYFATFDAELKRLSPRTTTGTVQFLSSGGPAGWGMPSGLDMADTLRAYGNVSGRGTALRLELGPNTGGAPTVGNASFSLRSSGGTPGMPAFWAIGANPLNLPVGGGLQLELLVSPDALLAVTVQPAPIGNQLTLPIPADPSLHGARLYAQTFVPDGAGIAASQGLAIRLQ